MNQKVEKQINEKLWQGVREPIATWAGARDGQRIQAPGLFAEFAESRSTWRVDEEDVYRVIRRMRLGQWAVERAVANPGGDAGNKGPP